MYSFIDEYGDECLRHEEHSYTIKDLKEIINMCNEDDEVLVCVDFEGGDAQIFPSKLSGSIYKSGDLLVIEVR